MPRCPSRLRPYLKGEGITKKSNPWKTTSLDRSIMGNQLYNGWCSHLGWAASFIKRAKLNYIFRSKIKRAINWNLNLYKSNFFFKVGDWVQLVIGTIFLLPIRALGVVLALLLAWLVAKVGLIGLSKVWPLTQFFLFPFRNMSLFYLESKSMTPHRGNTILSNSSLQLPRLCLGPLTRLVGCFQNYRATRTP